MSADLPPSTTLLPVAAVRGVRRCRSAPTIVFPMKNKVFAKTAVSKKIKKIKNLWTDFGFILAAVWHHIGSLFGIDFGIDLLMHFFDFLAKMAPTRVPKR